MNQKENRLIGEKSPYLLQHARNPVDWYPWGSEAFTKAQSEEKLILISIGYATCHWCHVMERESFEDNETAAILNDRFVSIKVDREELPDVDAIYMKALHAMGQPGGWPLNLFLTPDRRPVTGGTYFPPQPSHGRPSFKQILLSLSDLWKNDRGRIVEAASSLTEFLREQAMATVDGDIPDMSIFAQFTGELEQSFDPVRGGFHGNGPNKFPPSMALLLLLRLSDRDPGGSIPLIAMIERTLQAMMQGGIYDQIGGGLCRYSTDPAWLVPHFEKMLYDNALFIQALTETFRITRNETYRKQAYDVIDYLKRDLMSDDGAFFCAEDADSEGEEGKFYVWSFEEFCGVLKNGGLSQGEIELVSLYWDVSEQGNFEHSNILNRHSDDTAFSKANHIAVDSLQSLIVRARTILFTIRESRIRPLRDDKILTSWNSLMISALSRAAIVFGDVGLAGMAERSARFITTYLIENGKLLRRFRDGEARFPATLTDHALFGGAMIDLYRVTGRASYLHQALNQAEAVLADFFADGRLYETSEADSEDLFIRPIDPYDGVMPSGPSAALRLFVTLSRYGENTVVYTETAKAIMRQFTPEWKQAARAYPAMLSAFLSFQEAPSEIAITGEREFIQSALNLIGHYLDSEAIFAFPAGNEESVSLLQGKEFNRNAVYLCRDFVCKTPMHEIGTFEQALKSRENPAD